MGQGCARTDGEGGAGDGNIINVDGGKMKKETTEKTSEKPAE